MLENRRTHEANLRQRAVGLCVTTAIALSGCSDDGRNDSGNSGGATDSGSLVRDMGSTEDLG
jgi:hypothetical protein